MGMNFTVGVGLGCVVLRYHTLIYYQYRMVDANGTLHQNLTPKFYSSLLLPFCSGTGFCVQIVIAKYSPETSYSQ